MTWQDTPPLPGHVAAAALDPQQLQGKRLEQDGTVCVQKLFWREHHVESIIIIPLLI